MALKTHSEMRTYIASMVRDTQINSFITTFLNFTLAEIWNYHPWTFARRKGTLTTVASQEDYALDEEIDRLLIVRQRSTPMKIVAVPDHQFFQNIPNPEDLATSSPRYYRLWGETGFLANITTAETLNVVSSSTSDTSSFNVVIVGRNANGLVVSEIVTLNGTTVVPTSTTFQAAGLLYCSKSAKTTGTITISGVTSGTTFSRIAPEESAPRYKTISFYPIPNAAITIYLEYLERLRLLYNDTDISQLDHKWNWVLVEGALAKTWEYKQNDQAFAAHQQLFQQGLVMMRREDSSWLDYIPSLEPRQQWWSPVRRYADSSSSAFPSYGAGWL